VCLRAVRVPSTQRARGVGQDFGATGSAFIGVVPCPVVLWSDSLVTCMVPPGNAGGFVVQVRASAAVARTHTYTHIHTHTRECACWLTGRAAPRPQIVVAGQSSVSANSNAVLTYLPPRVTAIVPNHGPSGGMITVWVRGENFGLGTVRCVRA
jgi:hypothetical protein